MRHAHAPDHDHREDLPARPLILSLLLTLSFAGVEALAGLWSGSLALLGDAGHMVTDSAALGLAALAALVARRPASALHTYGFGRLEVVAGIANALFMLAIVAGIVSAALDRLADPPPVKGLMVIGVATIGLGINLLVAWLLSRGHTQSLNTRGALLHVIGDLLGSVAALSSGIVIITTGWRPIDPLLSLLICALITVSALRLLREAVHVVMEGAPEHVDVQRVEQALHALPGVRSVHDLHVWSVTSGTVALSAHLQVRDMGDWPETLAAAQDLLARRWGIEHATLQPELGDCGIEGV